MLSYFPRGVLDEILNLIESVSEDFPSYSFISMSYLLNILPRLGLLPRVYSDKRCLVINIEENHHRHFFQNLSVSLAQRGLLVPCPSPFPLSLFNYIIYLFIDTDSIQSQISSKPSKPQMFKRRHFPSHAY